VIAPDREQLTLFVDHRVRRGGLGGQDRLGGADGLRDQRSGAAHRRSVAGPQLGRGDDRRRVRGADRGDEGLRPRNRTR
jgi:hypothetical protein